MFIIFHNIICFSYPSAESKQYRKLTDFSTKKENWNYMLLSCQITNWVSPCQNKIDQKEEYQNDAKQGHKINHMMCIKPHQPKSNCIIFYLRTASLIVRQVHWIFFINSDPDGQPSNLPVDKAYLHSLTCEINCRCIHPVKKQCLYDTYLSNQNGRMTSYHLLGILNNTYTHSNENQKNARQKIQNQDSKIQNFHHCRIIV